MKSIKGLIVKDLLNLNHYKFSLFVMVMIFVGIGVADAKTLNFLPIMLMTMVGMIGLSTFNYDEISKADKYLLTLPTTNRNWWQYRTIYARNRKQPRKHYKRV